MENNEEHWGYVEFFWIVYYSMMFNSLINQLEEYLWDNYVYGVVILCASCLIMLFLGGEDRFQAIYFLNTIGLIYQPAFFAFQLENSYNTKILAIFGYLAFKEIEGDRYRKEFLIPGLFCVLTAWILWQYQIQK